MKELFIIRHGETDFNKQGIIQGSGVNPPLNEKGRLQSQLFFQHYEKENFDFIFTSELQRTHETVLPFTGKGIPWEQRSELNEICWGIYEGKRTNSIFRHEYQHLMESWQNGKLDEKTEGGESPNEVQQKQKRFIAELEQNPDNKILICMHGRAMRIFLSTLLNKPLHQMDEFPHHNVCVYKLLYNKKSFTIELFNNLNHLNGAN